jgi:hypothetical protein
LKAINNKRQPDLTSEVATSTSMFFFDQPVRMKRGNFNSNADSYLIFGLKLKWRCEVIAIKLL